jgi:predicted GNAT superfamily acetyltransferase
MLALASRRVVYHSHMAAVREDLRHRDIGYRIKLAQRQAAIEAGIPLIIWTFDPLQSRNAHFNINKLGAVIRRYEENYYGEGASTVFDPGVPSDRVFAEWWVRSPHVEAALGGARPQVEEDQSVIIPYDINSIRQQSVEEHLRWRLRVREDFQSKLGRGPIVRGFVSDGESEESRYILGPDEEQFRFEAYQGVEV